MLLVHSGVVRIIRKNSSNLWKSTWTPPQVRTTTEILSWFYGRFWSSSWPPCCFLHRQKKDFPNVSCHVPAHLDHPHLLPITHLLALPISQPLLYIYIYIYIHPPLVSSSSVHRFTTGFLPAPCLVLFAFVGVTSWHFLFWASPHVLRVSLSFICSENINSDISQLLCSPLVLMRGSPGFCGQTTYFWHFLSGGPVE